MYLGKNFCREINKPNKRTEKIINNPNIGAVIGFSLSIKWCANVIFVTIRISKHLIRNKYVLFGKIFT